jgi:hypothetical protein
LLFTRGALLGFWLFGTVACSVLGDDGGQEARVDHSGDIAGQVKTLVKLTGAEYVKKRDDLLKLVEGNSKQFSELRKTTKDWKVRLLCDILLERASKEKETDRFLKWKPGFPFERGALPRIKTIGEALAEKGRATPMLLVEKLWKNTAWKKWRIDRESDAYLCRALYVLKVAGAREVLEKKLEAEYGFTRMQAAMALGTIGDVRSVPALLRLLERDPECRDTDSAGARMAIPHCARKETIPLLRKTAEKAKTERMRMAIMTIVSKLEKPRR